MPMYQLRTDDDEVLAEAELPSDSKAMTWAVRQTTELSKTLGGRRWQGHRLVGNVWEHRFGGGRGASTQDAVA
ncbi:hypothetical protein [Rhodococcus sovatensis]|uniref:Uncharacterized protein n=1 Tax=Rhodococcus sovatensis TaxID=1805840 RepID=A0ABZ2PI06_9NOCA